jgi:hypothetical protein
LVRRVFRNPVALTVPILVILAISPYLLDLAREMQLQANRPDYRAESGVLDFALRHGAFLEAGQPISWVISGILMAHTFVFPLVALFDPEAYVQTASSRVLTLSWNAAGSCSFTAGYWLCASQSWCCADPRAGESSRSSVLPSD